MQLEIDKTRLKEVCNKNNIIYLGLFGSTARGENNQDSDIDLLVEFSKTKSLFELVDIQTSLEQIFPKRIDMVLKNNIKKRIKPYIFNDLIPLYEER